MIHPYKAVLVAVMTKTCKEKSAIVRESLKYWRPFTIIQVLINTAWNILMKCSDIPYVRRIKKETCVWTLQRGQWQGRNDLWLPCLHEQLSQQMSPVELQMVEFRTCIPTKLGAVVIHHEIYDHPYSKCRQQKVPMRSSIVDMILMTLMLIVTIVHQLWRNCSGIWCPVHITLSDL